MWQRSSPPADSGESNSQRSRTNFSHSTNRLTCGRSVGCGRCGCDRPAAEVDGLQALLDVQRPRPAVRPDAVPIEQPVGDVARLLDFGHQQAGAQGVDRAGGQEDAVARRGVRRRAGNPGTCLGGWPPPVRRGRRPASARHRSRSPARPRARPTPRSCPASGGSSRAARASSGWTWTESVRAASRNFSSKGNRGCGADSDCRPWQTGMSALAQQLAAMLWTSWPKRRPGQRAELDDALVRAVIGDFPAFGPIVAGRQRLAERGFQPPPPPKVWPQNRAKTKRIELAWEQ